jgi:predicted O-methyltransferase YrrM
MSLTRQGHAAVQRLRRHPRATARLAGVVGLGVLVAVAALAGLTEVAIAMIALMVAATLATLLVLAQQVAAAQRDTAGVLVDLRVLAEQTQRRVVAAVEKERLAALDRQEALGSAFTATVTEALAENRKKLEHGTDRLLRAQSREIEGLLQLFGSFTPRAPMPSSGDFALNPTDLLDMVHIVQRRRPRLVVELGSGTSTVWLAYALERLGGRLVSVDHDAGYAERTRTALAAHGLTGVAEVRVAALQPMTIDDSTYRWYDRSALADLHDIDLLLVDGPPEATGPAARFPALHVLADRLADSATVVLDDANRPHERDALQRWTETVPGLVREPELLGRHAVLGYVRPEASVVPA